MTKPILFAAVVSALFLPTFSASAGDDIDLLLGDELERGSLDTEEVDSKKKRKGKDDEPAFGEFDEPVEDFDLDADFDEPELLGNFEDDVEPFEFDATQKTRSAPAAGPGPITLDLAGKQPLADNYPLSVVAVERDAVVVELPVLVSRSRVGVDQGFQVIGDVFVGDTKVSTVRQVVEPASLAEFGPSFVFLKVLAPVVDASGEVKIVVKQAGLDGNGAKTLFSRVTPYRLK